MRVVWLLCVAAVLTACTVPAGADELQSCMPAAVPQHRVETVWRALTAPLPVRRLGCRGTGVKVAKLLLQGWGFAEDDAAANLDEFTPDFAKQLALFQVNVGLPSTGTLDEETWDKLFRYVRVGDTSPAVAAVRVLLREVYAYKGIEENTQYFDRDLMKAVADFQSQLGVVQRCCELVVRGKPPAGTHAADQAPHTGECKRVADELEPGVRVGKDTWHVLVANIVYGFQVIDHAATQGGGTDPGAMVAPSAWGTTGAGASGAFTNPDGTPGTPSTPGTPGTPSSSSSSAATTPSSSSSSPSSSSPANYPRGSGPPGDIMRVAGASSRGAAMLNGYPWGEDVDLDPKVMQLVEEGEGYRDCTYYCSARKLTFGIGFNLERGGAREVFRRLGVPWPSNCMCSQNRKCAATDAQIRALFLDDVGNFKTIAQNYAGTCWASLPKDVKAVLVDMAYNLGARGLGGFRNFKAALCARNWTRAAAEMADSSYCRQVARRCDRNRMVVGVFAQV